MRNCRSKIVVHIKPAFWVVLSFCLLTVPLKIIAGWIFAALFHEACHIAVLHLFHINIYDVQIGFLGAEIKTEPLSNRIEFYTAVAGPAGSIALILLHSSFPTIAFFALIQFISNAIPVGNRDGSRILRCLLIKLFGMSRGSRIHGLICIWVRWLVVFAFLYICIILKIVLPMIAGMLCYLIKIPCKARKQIVQYKHLKG